MKAFILLTLLMPALALAAPMPLECFVDSGAENPFSFEVELKDTHKNFQIAESGEYKIFLTAHPNNVVELQALDLFQMARVYATSELSAPGERVQLSLWKRGGLLEVICALRD